jgi:hypothetical protein
VVGDDLKRIKSVTSVVFVRQILRIRTQFPLDDDENKPNLDHVAGKLAALHNKSIEFFSIILKRIVDLENDLSLENESGQIRSRDD